MKLAKVLFHNFRSASDSLTECSLAVEPGITCLIGSSESGKSNLLEAMAKFESGGFTFDDVPRSVVSGSTVSPPVDLPIISAIYELDENDSARLHDLLDSPEGPEDLITLSRNYEGPIYSALAERSFPQIGEDLTQRVSDFGAVVARFLRGYNRQRRRWGSDEIPTAQATTIWLNRFRRAAAAMQFDSMDSATELGQLFGRFRDSYVQLDAELMERVPRRTRLPAEEAMQQMEPLIQELLSATDGGSPEVLASRPKFRLISSDPGEWLRGEYSSEELLGEADEDGSVTSALLLLEIGGLDFARLGDVPDYLVPDLLDEASTAASERLNRYWSQEEIGIRFQLSARTGNLIIYVVTDDHRGLPTQRSLGFRWYLEFLLTYAHARESGHPIVLLFDEPGIHLHPKAQEDLKRLLRRDISQHMQVIFTTHLPGMVDTTRLDALRGVVKNEQRRRGTWVLNERVFARPQSDHLGRDAQSRWGARSGGRLPWKVRSVGRSKRPPIPNQSRAALG